MKRQSTRAWWRLGHRVAGAGGNTFASFALGLAVASVILSSTAFIAAFATYEGRSMREGARIPVIVEQPDEALLSWVQTHDSLASRAFTVIYIEPFEPTAPLPPGLDAWPQPGHYVASPQVIALGSEEAIGERFGILDGVISSDGLVSPTEMLVYARAQTGSEPSQRASPVRGFGIDNPRLGIGLIGEALWVQPLGKFVTLMAFFLIAPCLLLLTASSRLRLPERQRRNATLSVLGTPARFRAHLDIATIARPVAWGIAAGFLAIAVACFHDVPLWGTGYILQSEDLRRHFGAIVLSAVVSIAVFVAAFVFAGRTRHGTTSTRPSASQRPPRKATAALAAFAAPAATGAVLVIRETGGVTWAINLYLLALVVTIVTLAQLVGWATYAIARVLRQQGHEEASPGKMVAGAGLMRDYKPVVRFGSAIAAMMIVAAQAQSLNAMAGQDAVYEIALREELDGAYAEVLVEPEHLNHVSALITRLDAIENTAIIVLHSTVSGRPGVAMEHTIWADPAGLVAWNLPTEDSLESIVGLPRQDFLALGRYIAVGERAQIESVPFSEASSSNATTGNVTIYIRATDGEPLSLNNLKDQARAVIHPANVGYVGESAYLGAWMGRHQGRWLGWFATIGTILLAAALLAAGSDDVARSARKLAPSSALFGARRVVGEYAAWRIAIPTGIGIAVGGLIGLMLTSPLTIIADVPAPLTALTSTALAAMMISLLLWALISREARRLSRRWDGKVVSSP